MILTEDEAKLKWCHQAGHEAMPCAASNCMAWRWSINQIVTGDTIAGAMVRTEISDKGFCGLAGQPSYRE